MRLAPEPGGFVIEPIAHFRDKMARAEVEDAVDGVEAERVGVILGEPEQRVFDKQATHPVASGAVEVERLAPRTYVRAGETGPVVAQIIPFGTKVVVDNVDHDREACAMAFVDQALQSL